MNKAVAAWEVKKKEGAIADAFYVVYNMKSRPLDILSTMLMMLALESILYFVLPKHLQPATSARPVPNSLNGIDTLAIVNGDTVFIQGDTIIDR